MNGGGTLRPRKPHAKTPRIMGKRRIIITLCLLAGLACGGAAQTMSRDFVPLRNEHDFGTVDERKGGVSHTFTFRNKGRKPVTIVAANTFCGCTAASFSKKPIQPGATGEVTVVYTPRGQKGDFRKEVNVVIDGGKEFARVWIKGRVKPYLHPVTESHPYYFGHGLYMSHATLNFAGLRQGDSFSFPLHIANDTKKPMTIRLVRQPDNRVLKIFDTLTLKPLERRVVTVSYKAPKTYAHNRGITIKVYVNGKEARQLPVRWFGTGNRRVLHCK